MTKKTNKKVLIFGSFDLLHPGHISLMRYAQQYGEVTAVVARDVTIRTHKKNPPYHDEHTRLQTLAATDLVTAVLGNTEDYYAVLDTYQPDTIVLGYDQQLFTDKLEHILREKNIPATIIRAPSFFPEHFKSSRLRRALADPDARFVCINKPSGMTSHDVVYTLRRKLHTKKIGHAGTLDPLASGVLICGVGKATTLLDWWHAFYKSYKAELEFGKISDTYDSEGMLTNTKHTMKPTTKSLTDALNTFVGTIEQIPPGHSAKKVNGKKAYELARSGKTVTLKPQIVTIHSCHLESYVYPKATISITCSTGTYIRSLIHDLGQALGCGAIMTELTRTAIGPVTIDKCQSLDDTLQGIDVLSFHHFINQYFLERSNNEQQ